MGARSANADDDWPTTSTVPWEHNHGGTFLDPRPWLGDGNTSEEGHWLAPAGAQWVQALSDGRVSPADPTEGPTNAEGPVLKQSQLDEILNNWAGEEEQTEDEDRQEAVRRIKAWGEAGDLYARLELTYLCLTTLPPTFPPDLRTLDVSENELMHLPDNLPAELRTLDVRGNRMTSLPDTLPAALQLLAIGGNELTSLPVTLPDGLQTLAVASNRLTSLPETLPAELQQLDVRG